MDNTINIKCPVCGVILKVVDKPDNANKNVTCPNCKVKNKFVDFKVVPKPAAAPSAPGPAPRPQEDDSERTRIRTQSNPAVTPGFFEDRTTGMRYDIPDGVSTVGRKTVKTPPKADIPITTSDKFMSRVHMNVRAAVGKDGLYHVYVSNGENKNPTYLNGKELKGDDFIGIKHGDALKLGDTVLVYYGSSTEMTDKTELHLKK